MCVISSGRNLPIVTIDDEIVIILLYRIDLIVSKLQNWVLSVYLSDLFLIFAICDYSNSLSIS